MVEPFVKSASMEPSSLRRDWQCSGVWLDRWTFVCECELTKQDIHALDHPAVEFFALYHDNIKEKEVEQLHNLDVMEVTYTGERMRLTFLYSLRGYSGTSVRPRCHVCNDEADLCRNCRNERVEFDQ